MGMLGSLLTHPLTRGMDLDDPSTTALRKRLVREKPFLRQIYAEWYAWIRTAVPAGEGGVLEIGSGPGFLREVLPETITSDLLAVPDLSLVADARRLPFADGALRAIVATDVLHHLPDVRAFFTDAARCVRPGGAIALVEPWITPWSRFVWGRLHHEPCEPEARSWELPEGGPLSVANSALPWILFERDRAHFEQELSGWAVETITPGMPLRYLISGGVSLRALMPGWSFALWRGLERALGPLNRFVGMYANVVLRRRMDAAEDFTRA